MGTVVISETPYGLLFAPELKGLPTGVYGFYIHENVSCASAENNGKTMPVGVAGGYMAGQNRQIF